MAKEEYKKIGFNLSNNTIDKLNECIRLRNQEYSSFDVSYSKKDFITDLINKEYNRLIGESLDADVNDRLNQKIDYEVGTRLKGIESNLSDICSELLITKKLLDFFVQKSVPSADKVVEESLQEDDDQDGDEIRKMYLDHFKDLLNKNSDALDLIEEMIVTSNKD